MSPITHFFGSWLVASATATNPRDRTLITLAGVAPDLDGLGVIPDVVGSWISGTENTFHYYQYYHHYLLHGWPGAVVICGVLTLFAKQHWRVLLMCLVTFHLHLLCDLIGSRGPTPSDLWPICYNEPLFHRPAWFWKYQWRLDGWQNRMITLGFFAAVFWRAERIGHSCVEVFSRRADRIFVETLRKWRGQLIGQRI